MAAMYPFIFDSIKDPGLSTLLGVDFFWRSNFYLINSYIKLKRNITEIMLILLFWVHLVVVNLLRLNCCCAVILEIIIKLL